MAGLRGQGETFVEKVTVDRKCETVWNYNGSKGRR